MTELLHELKNNSCMSQQGKRKTKSLLDFYTKQKSKFSCVPYAHSQFLCSLRKIRSFKLGCAPVRPVPHFGCSTAGIRQDISAASFFSCKLLWRIDNASRQNFPLFCLSGCDPNERNEPKWTKFLGYVQRETAEAKGCKH